MSGQRTSTELITCDLWPKTLVSGHEPIIFIYDEILHEKLKHQVLRRMAANTVALPVKAGEKLKSLKNYSEFILKIQRAAAQTGTNKPWLIACGGGSVGDFTGFLAATFRRGLPLCLIPSTWLAAIDSAHGGKNGLNLEGVKNQIGTFYSPSKVILCKDLLFAQPKERAMEGFPELLKILLCTNSKASQRLLARRFEPSLLWEFLPIAIDEKLRIVKRDPFEKLGHRRILNFGHTMGHVFEAELSLPHGLAVYCGMEFSLRWGLQAGTLSPSTAERLRAAPVIKTYRQKLEGQKTRSFDYLSTLKKTKKSAASILANDKKGADDNKLWFLFLNSIGKVEQMKLKIPEITTEMHRQLSAREPGVLL